MTPRPAGPAHSAGPARPASPTGLDHLAPQSADRPVVLDGGLSNALEDRGVDLSSQLWTATVLRGSPEEVEAVHAAYFAAGAEVATTASYQVSEQGVVAAGGTPQEARALLARSVEVARRARDAAQELRAGSGGPGHRGAERGRLLVAASVGPYGAVLADGSEYRGDYGLSPTALRDFHARRLDALAAAGPDLLAVETLPDVREAEVLVPLLDDLGLPAWVSYSVAGGRTRAGQPLEEAYAVLAGSTSVVAAGLNCSAPGEVAAAVRVAAEVTGLPGVVYPNRGETWDAVAKAWRGERDWDVAPAAGWVDAGARLVGGCCRVGPADIERLARSLGA
ncbi:homocysteine S-methyltransferase [Nocardioides kribbensis]|uniref:homocysteine S-methyltransferase n=1 Tax=Nocardioides kribbensis TaxID=305517 RepID=UPI0032DB65CD